MARFVDSTPLRGFEVALMERCIIGLTRDCAVELALSPSPSSLGRGVRGSAEEGCLAYLKGLRKTLQASRKTAT